MASTPRRFGRILFGFALLFWIWPAAAAELDYPQLTGRVVDNADLLNADDRAELETELKTLEDKGSDQVVVVTLPSLQGLSIEDFGYQLGRHWGIGTKEKDNGVLLIGCHDEEDTVVLLLSADAPMASKLITKVLDGEALQRGQSYHHDLVRALVLEGLELGFKLGPVVCVQQVSIVDHAAC